MIQCVGLNWFIINLVEKGERSDVNLSRASHYHVTFAVHYRQPKRHEKKGKQKKKLEICQKGDPIPMNPALNVVVSARLETSNVDLRR